MERSTVFTVYGDARPQGSKTLGNKGGQHWVRDADPRLKGWRLNVGQAAAVAHQGKSLITGPVSLDVTFYRPRNVGHYGTGRNAGKLKPSAPPYPAVAPDVDKLVRAVCDSLSGIVYRDDAQVVDLVARKRFGEPARAEVIVTALGQVREAPKEQLALAAA
jgi:Holliday junction resolvase RusA-like endonuclease